LIDYIIDWLCYWMIDWMIVVSVSEIKHDHLVSCLLEMIKIFLDDPLILMTFQNRTMTRMESFAWRYFKSYNFHDWSNSDRFLIKFWSNSDLCGDYRRIHDQNRSETNKILTEDQKFIKIARHCWDLESRRALSSRPKDLRT
jgi:hypothetical protein